MKKILIRPVFATSARRLRHNIGAMGRAKRFRLAAATLGIIGLGVTSAIIGNQPSSTATAGTATLPAPVGPEPGTPSYTTILPSGKSSDALGGWTRVSPPDRNPVYAYVDTVGSTRLIVSEQQLPKEFEKDPEGQTAQLATNYNATKKLTVGSTTVYIGTSTEGPQSAIFQRDGLLVLMKAGSSIDDAVWEAYVNSLQ